ncbi:unnamed protein product [Laminaria digitata]
MCQERVQTDCNKLMHFRSKNRVWKQVKTRNRGKTPPLCVGRQSTIQPNIYSTAKARVRVFVCQKARNGLIINTLITMPYMEHTSARAPFNRSPVSTNRAHHQILSTPLHVCMDTTSPYPSLPPQ